RFGCLDSDGDGISDADATWTLDNGADACPLAYGNSTMDRIGCVDTDGDGYSDETNDWGLDLGADAYPKDPTRWILEPQDEESLMASSTVLIGGGVGIVVVLVAVGILMRRRKGDEPKGWDQAAPVAMPDFSAQPGMYGQPPTQTYAQPVAQYNPAQSVAQPAAVAQPVGVQPGPAVQPDPARDYYNSLLAQGYPHADAMKYTQQYYGHFQG
ncbi:MAG: hypothetical protein L7U25_05980, partial [Candidatus Poseidonia sp.]|nr:hypothetical protein [Poseidonia sp.]